MPIRRTPPAAVSAAARRGLKLYEDGKGGDGLKPETVRRARSIAAGEAQSVEWLTVEAPAWFARHDKTRPEDGTADSPWLTAWLLWGGNPGRAWADREKARRATLEEKGETLMAMTIPTSDGQSLGDFLEELRDAVTMRLRGLAPMGSDPWIRIEEDSITGESVVGEVCGTGEDMYYRMSYSRSEDGRLVLSEPVRVDEVTTYVDAPGPLPLSAVLCEMAPVHAPAAEGLVRGKVAQLMRVGPLHDAYTGAHLLDVTDELLASIVTAAGAGFSIPIDYAHALYGAQAGGTDAAAVPLYGRVTALEHRPGDGLYGVPEYTAAGAAMLGANPGLLFFSPTLVGTMHDPATGKPLGRGLHSVSLTPTPRQNNIDSLALARAAAGAESPKGGPMGLKDGAGTDKPADVVQLSRTEHDALVLARTERDTFKAKADAAEADVLSLAQRLDAVEKARHAEAVAAEVKGYEARRPEGRRGDDERRGPRVRARLDREARGGGPRPRADGRGGGPRFARRHPRRGQALP
jgi:hypothetical protein